jgi:hypothetical protein
MNEGQHVGDHLDDRGIAERPHVKNLVSHRLQRRQVQIEQVLVAARQHGDLALGGQMHAAGHRQFHGAHALFGGDRPEPQDLVPAER